MRLFGFVFVVCSIFAIAGKVCAADVEPIPAPLPPSGPVVILTAHALDGHGGTLEDARIGVADGKITPSATSECMCGLKVTRSPKVCT